MEVELNEFSGDKQFFTILAVATISDIDKKSIVSRKSFRQALTMDTPDYPGYVDAASRAIANLSEEIATALRTDHQLAQKSDDASEQTLDP
ncbi:membrane integrity-associated transporter subunit PqiC [Desulfobulbus alkaliphilus]|nr:membrane integrity-associated transporter subunit PqiC [Desulfobulbus alkaliphilus]